MFIHEMLSVHGIKCLDGAMSELTLLAIHSGVKDGNLPYSYLVLFSDFLDLKS